MLTIFQTLTKKWKSILKVDKADWGVSPITPQSLPNEEVEVPKKFYFANDIVLSEQEVAVLEVIRENLIITQQEIATKLNVDRELIKYYVKRLKKNKVLDRQGTNRSGKWIVNEELLVQE